MYLKLKIELLSLILNFSSSLPPSSPLSPDVAIIKHLVPEFLYFFLLWNFLSPLPLCKLYTHPPKREYQRPMLGNTLIVVPSQLSEETPSQLIFYQCNHLSELHTHQVTKNLRYRLLSLFQIETFSLSLCRYIQS